MSAPASQPTLTDDQVYNQGDFTIISSGGAVRFHVDSQQMRSASKGFNDMFEVGSGPMSIDMSDPDIEGPEAIRLWLDAIMGRLPAVDATLFGKAVHIVQLARKYDCPAICSSILELVSKAPPDITSTVPVKELIVFAASNDLSDMVASAIRRGDSFSTMHRRFDQQVDPALWEFADWQRLPIDYAWAISQACKRVRTRNNQARWFLDLIGGLRSAAEKRRRLSAAAKAKAMKKR